jgi:hypothetical protein
MKSLVMQNDKWGSHSIFVVLTIFLVAIITPHDDLTADGIVALKVHEWGAPTYTIRNQNWITNTRSRRDEKREYIITYGTHGICCRICFFCMI